MNKIIKFKEEHYHIPIVYKNKNSIIVIEESEEEAQQLFKQE